MGKFQAATDTSPNKCVFSCFYSCFRKHINTHVGFILYKNRIMSYILIYDLILSTDQYNVCIPTKQQTQSEYILLSSHTTFHSPSTDRH